MNKTSATKHLLAIVVLCVIVNNGVSASTEREPSSRQSRRYPLPYWLRELEGLLDGQRQHQQHRTSVHPHNTGDIFAGDLAASQSNMQSYAPEQTDNQQDNQRGSAVDSEVIADVVPADTLFAVSQETAKSAALIERGEAVEASIDFGSTATDQQHLNKPGRRPLPTPPPCETDQHNHGVSKKPTAASYDVPSFPEFAVEGEGNTESITSTSVDIVIDENERGGEPQQPNAIKCHTYGASYFCENDTNYPTEEVKQVLSKDTGHLLQAFFATDNKDSPKQAPSVASDMFHESGGVVEPVVATRFKPSQSSPTSEPEQLCNSKREFLFPQKARNLGGVEMTIVNQDNISQPITIETCRNNGGPCKYTDSFPAGVKPFCQQKYVTHHMAAFKDGQIVRESFQFPSCCVCVVKMSSFFSERSGRSRTTAVSQKRRKRNLH